MDSNHIEIRVTQNGKTRNYISKVSETFLSAAAADSSAALEPVPVRVTLFATGRCINKLVTIIEVSKSLIPHELHQYTVLSTVDKDDGDIVRNDEDENEGEERDRTAKATLTSQLVITLCTHKLLDSDVNANTAYQHHDPASLKQDTAADTGTGIALPSQSTRQVGIGSQDKSVIATAKGFKRRQRGGKAKKKDIEDAKNVLF